MTKMYIEHMNYIYVILVCVKIILALRVRKGKSEVRKTKERYGRERVENRGMGRGLKGVNRQKEGRE